MKIMAPSNARYCKVYRNKSKVVNPPDNLKSKNKFINTKKKVNELSRRLVDKEYDEKIREMNKARVKKSRDKKKEELNRCYLYPSSQFDDSSTAKDDSLSSPCNDDYSANDDSSSSQANDDSSSSPAIDDFSSCSVIDDSTSSPANVDSSSSSATDDSSLSPTNDDSLSSTVSDTSSANLTSGSAGDFVAPLVVKFPFSTPSKSKRQESGLKRRRETLRNKNDTIEELHTKVIILDAEISQLEEDNVQLVKENVDLKRNNQALSASSAGQFSWVKQMWKYCNQNTKRDIKAALEAAKDEIPKGTLRGIRDQAGLNFSNPATESVTSRGSDELKTKIEVFAHTNSFEVPDMKLSKKNIRYMRHMKTTLHQQFLLDNPSLECHYTTFCLYFPKNIKKPGINSHGSCLCEDCQNFSLKHEALRRAKLLADKYDVDLITKSARAGDTEEESKFLDDLKNVMVGDSKNRVVSYFVWEDDKKTIVEEDGTSTKLRKMMRKNYQVTASTLAERTLVSYESLKEHLYRDSVIKSYIRSARQKLLKMVLLLVLLLIGVRMELLLFQERFRVPTLEGHHTPFILDIAT